MKKFKVGDKVIVIDSVLSHVYNRVGFVLENNRESGYPYAVELLYNGGVLFYFKGNELQFAFNGVERMIECLK
jgi:hypothetical protein